MRIRGLRAGLTILLLAATAGLSADLDFRQELAVMDSLRTVPPRLRNRWLNEPATMFLCRRPTDLTRLA
jgi:hypothetical protein